MPYKSKEDRNAHLRLRRKIDQEYRARINAQSRMAKAKKLLEDPDERQRRRDSDKRQAETKRIYARRRYNSDPAYRERKLKSTDNSAHKNPEVGKARRRKRRAAQANAQGFFTAEEWFTLCFAVGFKCLCCVEKKLLEADHVVPLSKGGDNYLHNIQPLCKTCNLKKGTKTIDFRITLDLNTTKTSDRTRSA